MNWKEFDKVLGQNLNNVDYWGDEESIYAADLLKDFDDKDWLSLEKEWKSRPDVWKERCAQLIDLRKDQKSLSILAEMLETGNLDITINAIESLQGFVSESNWDEINQKRVDTACQTIDRSTLIDSYKSELTDFLKSKL
ncbi:hypothetical protein [Pseudobacteriovorax antillogorgiicola]|uniref:HEAT repeat-containing protein n=1 Tax=Pseudobacteriovorax antillogorgiicola TaxID=1513793 RepID=A0A1Y6C0T6_9BACT|nr:hypothetical protein [Pseudobacteriovorax antillogorgiicola]TCS52289.1 hypothetical protein EDD56_10933 [Pseudobacteriovorax antillogorgiicola]SMF30561.1 hypothetical protein SAMN06296036_109180 [Pseudobacteriovorax antillogorgiicola]